MTQSMFQLLVAPRGRGPCVAIPGEQPYPGWSWWEAVSGVEPVGSRIRGGVGEHPYLILLPSIPVHRIVVDIGIGGGGRETGPHPRGARAVCLPDACGLKPAL
jgi:hypothetical protein